MARGKQAATGMGNRIAPVRFLLFVAVLVISAVALWYLGVSVADSLEYGFDSAVVVFLASMWPLLGDIGATKMRAHAGDNDANRALVLIITIVISLAVLAAIAGDLPKAKKGDIPAMATLIGTLFLAWAYANTVFALHYAHAFYSKEPKEGGDIGGLEFPGTKEPDYWDFLYFSFTLGMSFGSPDVNITRGAVRRIVVAQSFLMFVYNIGVVAFIINALGGGGG